MVQAINETIPVQQIKIGERVRDEMGDVAALADSIVRFGLIHAIVVDEEDRLLCGGRRLAALKRQGVVSVDVRRLIGLDEIDKRLVELEENARRKDLTAFEWAKTITQKADVVEEILDKQSPARQSRRSSTLRAQRRRRGTAKGTGTTSDILKRSDQHVAIAEMYPFLQGKGWSQECVFQAHAHLGQLTEAERPAAVQLVSEQGIPPKDQLKILETLVVMDEERRAALLECYQSPDPRDQLLAKTAALKLMPIPDVRRGMALDAKKALERARDKFPEDMLVPRFNQLIGALQQLIEEIESQDKERIDVWKLEAEPAGIVS